MPDGKATIEANAIYSRREAAQALGVSLSTLKKLVDLGYLDVSQPPGMRRIFIKGSSILDMLDRTTLHVVERERLF
ncbi:MAG: DNA-binding protein [Anaerolineae bacterium]|jgi:predicted site-specific integrase-resolvase|nr:MAG: DNA-binding protein [Anaerolineae bacterium]MCL4879383.1 DNA-binding protein [Anaerolineae bacterium]